MRTLVTYLVAASLTLHMLLGCCWHHAHEGNAGAKETKAPASIKKEVAGGTKRCRCHRHQPQVTAPQQKPADNRHDIPVGESDTCGEKCSFVTTNRVQVDQDQLQGGSSFGHLVCVISPEQTPGLTYRRSEIRDRPETPPSVRLHLLHQLLLI